MGRYSKDKRVRSFKLLNLRISIIEKRRKSGIVQDLLSSSFRLTRSITFSIVLYCYRLYLQKSRVLSIYALLLVVGVKY